MNCDIKIAVCPVSLAAGETQRVLNEKEAKEMLNFAEQFANRQIPFAIYNGYENDGMGGVVSTPIILSDYDANSRTYLLYFGGSGYLYIPRGDAILRVSTYLQYEVETRTVSFGEI